MPNVGFKNIFDEEVTYRENDCEYLLPAVKEYAHVCESRELYNSIMKDRVSLSVNSQIIHPDDWALYKVNQEDTVIITSVLCGDSLGAIIEVAFGVLLIAAAFVFPPSAFPLLGIFSKGALILGGAMFALGGISSLLFQPTLPKLSNYSASTSQSYSWSGIKTTAQYDSPISVIYGTHPVGGNIISAFTDSYGYDSYLYMLLALGEGEIDGICHYYNHASVCLTTDPTSANYRDPAITLNNQPLHNYSDVQWWYRSGTNTFDYAQDQYYPFAQNKIPYFDGTKTLMDDGREITMDGIVYTTSKEVDKITLQIQAPLLYRTIDNRIVPNEVEYKIEWKNADDSTYTTLTAQEYTPSITSSTGSPTSLILIWYGYSGTVYAYGNFSQATYTVTVTNRIEESDLIHYLVVEVKNNISEETIIHHISLKASLPTGYNPIVHSGPIHYTYSVEQYQDIEVGIFRFRFTSIPPVGAIYTISSAATNRDTSSFVIAGQSQSDVFSSVTIDFASLVSLDPSISRAIYDIKVSRKVAKSEEFSTQDTIILNSVTEIIEGDFIYPNTALLAFRIRASEQLSGGIPNIVTTVRGREVEVPSMTGVTATPFDNYYWNSTTSVWEDYLQAENPVWDNVTYKNEYSENSMLCTRDLILNTRYGLGKYLTTSDVYSTGVIAAIKECHKRYDPYDTSHEYLSWWTDMSLSSTEWKKFRFVVPPTSIGGTYTFNDATRTITLTNVPYIQMKVDLNQPTFNKGTYTFTLTIDSLASSTTVQLQAGIYGWVNDTTMSKLGTISNITTGTTVYTLTFNYNKPLYALEIDIKNAYPKAVYYPRFTARITNLSFTSDTLGEMHNHDVNGVLESEQSALTALSEICSSYRCWPVWKEGKFDFIINKDDTPVHTLSEGNMSGFTQSFIGLSEIPYKIIGQYTDEARDYNLTSIVAIAATPIASTLIQTNDRQVGLKWITNRWKAERETKFLMNNAINITHSMTGKCNIDALHCSAGDIVNIQSQLPVWNYGGRILDYKVYNNYATALILDVGYTFTYVASNHLISFQNTHNSFVTGTVVTTEYNDGDTTDVIEIESHVGTPVNQAVYNIGVAGAKKFRLSSVQRSVDDEIEITGIEHLSAIYTEPDITIIHEDLSRLPSTLEVPDAPTNISILPTNISEGIGINISANYPYNRIDIDRIEVFMTPVRVGESFRENSMRSVGILHNDGRKLTVREGVVIDFEITYYFLLYCVTTSGIKGKKAVTSIKVDQEYYRIQLPIPQKINIKDSDYNIHTFLGQDVTIEWEPVSYAGGYFKVDGYRVDVYSSDGTTLLRTAFTSSPSYTYTYKDNLIDNGGSTFSTTVYFMVSSRSSEGDLTSYGSPLFQATNTVPDDLISISGYSRVGGVSFTWNKSEELDHSHYSYRTKISSGGTWSSWTSIPDTTLIRTLTIADITTYGSVPTVYIEVKDVDYYDQSSVNAIDTSVTAHVIAESIFIKSVSNSGGSGTLTDLFDGNTTSGGWTVT